MNTHKTSWLRGLFWELNLKLKKKRGMTDLWFDSFWPKAGWNSALMMLISKSGMQYPITYLHTKAVFTSIFLNHLKHVLIVPAITATENNPWLGTKLQKINKHASRERTWRRKTRLCSGVSVFLQSWQATVYDKLLFILVMHYCITDQCPKMKLLMSNWSRNITV